MDSDYRFGNFLQLSAFRSKDKASLTDSFRSVGAFAGIVLKWHMRISFPQVRPARSIGLLRTIFETAKSCILQSFLLARFIFVSYSLVALVRPLKLLLY